MRQLLISLLGIGMLGFLMGCSSTCWQGGCGYDDYNSQCGEFSCTNNDVISDFSNPCPGPYQCDVDP